MDEPTPAMFEDAARESLKESAASIAFRARSMNHFILLALLPLETPGWRPAAA